MKHLLQKILSFFTAIALLFSSIPATFAEDIDETPDAGAIAEASDEGGNLDEEDEEEEDEDEDENEEDEEDEEDEEEDENEDEDEEKDEDRKTSECAELRGIRKMFCMRREKRKIARGRSADVRQDAAAHERILRCLELKGREKALCKRELRKEKKERLKERIRAKKQKKVRDRSKAKRGLRDRVKERGMRLQAAREICKELRGREWSNCLRENREN